MQLPLISRSVQSQQGWLCPRAREGIPALQVSNLSPDRPSGLLLTSVRCASKAERIPAL